MRLAIVGSALLVALCGCAHASAEPPAQSSPQARAELEAAKQKAATGDVAASKDLDRIAAQYPHTDVASDALFEEGELAFTKKDWSTARDHYRTLLTQFPSYPRASDASLHLGQSLLALHDDAAAVQTLAPLYDKLPESEKPSAAQSLAEAATRAGKYGEAVRFLAEGEKNVADPAAKAKIDRSLYALVESRVPELEIARLAQELKPDSPAYALVQFKLARIAFHLHNWDQLKQVLETLQQNEPQNPFSAEAQKLLDRAQRRDQVNPHAVGVLLPLSGKYALFGQEALTGIKLGLAKERDLQLTVIDTAGDPEKAKEGVAALVLDQQVMAIIGPIAPAEAEAAVLQANELAVPLIALSKDQSLMDKGPYAFRNMLTNAAQAHALVDYSVKVRGFKTFGVLFPNWPYGVELANDFWDDVLDAGGVMNAAESYDEDQTTFTTTVKKLVGRYYLEDRADYLEASRSIHEATKDPFKLKKQLEKLRSGLKPIVDFEALFIPDQQKNIGLVAPALAAEDMITNGCDAWDMDRVAKTMGVTDWHKLKTVVLLGANGWDSPDLVERGGKFVHCSVFVDGFWAGSARASVVKFVDAYKGSFEKTPGLLAAYGYDSGKLVTHVLSKSKPITRDAFRDALAAVKNLPGASGPISVNAHNEAEHPIFFLTVDKNGLKEIIPQEESAKPGETTGDE